MMNYIVFFTNVLSMIYEIIRSISLACEFVSTLTTVKMVTFPDNKVNIIFLIIYIRMTDYEKQQTSFPILCDFNDSHLMMIV